MLLVVYLCLDISPKSDMLLLRMINIKITGSNWDSMEPVMVRFTCQLGWAIVRSYSNTDVEGTVTYFIDVINVHNQLTWKRIILGNLDEQFNQLKVLKSKTDFSEAIPPGLQLQSVPESSSCPSWWHTLSNSDLPSQTPNYISQFLVNSLFIYLLLVLCLW